MNKCRTVLVDDHHLVRSGIRLLLELQGHYEVVAEYAIGREAIGGIAILKPDLVLLDISLPDMSGLDVLEALKSSPLIPAHTTPHVLMVSMHADKTYADRALRLGASGYLIKDSAPEELEAALIAVANGETWISPLIRTTAEPHGLGELPTLSRRQQEVLVLIVRGTSTKDIATKLGLSAKTIEAHRAQIMAKLGIFDIPGLVLYAVRQGLITP
jgi:DNA-binding NarL/FixJ family response regulator